MNEYIRGQSVRFYGTPVRILSRHHHHSSGLVYIVEDADGTVSPAKPDELHPMGIANETREADHAVSHLVAGWMRQPKGEAR